MIRPSTIGLAAIATAAVACAPVASAPAASAPAESAPATSASAQSARQTDRAPNFVVILADDLGAGDISPHDGWIETPVLDRLADEGMVFTDFYANGPVCTPTRAALVTGRYQQRAGLESVLYSPPTHPMQNRGHGLGINEITFADALGADGYATAVFGKWHLGYLERYNPVFNGFDRFRGLVSGNVDYFAHVDGAGYYDWWDGDRLVNEPGYLTHLVTRASVAFIEENRDRPFVLYVAHQAPHFPFQGPDGEPFRLIGKRGQAGNQGERDVVRQAYREMVAEMDTGIGEIVAALERHGLDDNTLVVFMSDNGPLPYGSAGDLRGFKGSVWEGGIRAPAIVWAPGRIQAGSTSSQPAMSLDLMPTMLDMAGVGIPAGHSLDGVSLRPALEGGTLRDRTLFWQYEGQAAVRDGKWKLVVDPVGEEGVFLFDLANDPSETTNLADRSPDQVQRLTGLLEAWREDVARGATAQPAPGEPTAWELRP